MSFEGDSRLAARLRESDFFLLVELNAPPREQPFESAVAVGAAMAKRIRSIDEVVGIAVTDRLRKEESHDPVDTAGVFMEASDKPILLHISGKGAGPERVKDILARSRSKRIRSVLAVTGDRSDLHEVGTGRHTADYANGYTDSVDILRVARKMVPEFSIGAAVNPFKYTVADQRLQVFKMVRKLASGAQFLVAQAGWDMKKLQELQWTLQMRELGHAVIARVLLLSLDDIKTIGDSVTPGVPVPRQFAAALQRESNMSAQQSLAAQLRRIGLQVAGCRLLGFSGVQIAGLRDLQTLDMVIGSARECLAKHTDYDRWLQAWNEFHASLSFAPAPGAYYAYRNLMEPGVRVYTPETCPMTAGDLPEAQFGERVRSHTVPFAVSSRRPSWLSTAAKRVLKLDEKALRALPYCYGLDNRDCPKRLTYGACGGAAADGTCEFGHAPCFFHRVLALAAHHHELDRLEEGVPL
jgi:methylenetetrahydrofolate reductase (NADPH)